ncbi:MAG: cyclic nucleotide-binding domain-containing protein, partial [Acidobacteria bacterium]|nr:cyclic nucleotide-binding domain-containing protein [Acidobacteriota bacterium]
MSSPNRLSTIPLFRSLDAAGQTALHDVMVRQPVKAGDPIVWFGDHGDTMFVVDEGRVEVTAPDREGGHVLLDTLGPGGVFGELGLIDGGP